MRTIAARSALALLGLCLLSADDPKAVLRSLLPKNDPIPDPQWKAKSGDRVTIEADGTPACRDWAAFGRFVKAAGAEDRVGVDQLLSSSAVTRVPKGGHALILKGFRPEPPPRRARAGLSGEQVGRQIQETILNAAGDETDYPVEVRFLDGPKKDQTALVPESSIAPRISRPTPRSFFLVNTEGIGSAEDLVCPQIPAAARRGAKPPEPSVRANSLLRIGQRLQERGDEVGAVGAYWFAMIDYPDLPQAPTAARRLAAMGFYRDGDGTYRLDPSRRQKRSGRR